TGKYYFLQAAVVRWSHHPEAAHTYTAVAGRHPRRSPFISDASPAASPVVVPNSSNNLLSARVIISSGDPWSF
ncbi:hypothetical protein Taro_040768, partial [Colocasia esculenta]|nr:hypothetical protein [Colocasia esculenta]